jgi:hypothetical protein
MIAFNKLYKSTKISYIPQAQLSEYRRRYWELFEKRKKGEKISVEEGGFL